MLAPMSLLAQSNPVTPAINQLGLDLLRAQASAGDHGNLLLSPYSIEVALAMAYTGADGRTRDEMQRVLHLPGDDAAVFDGFSGSPRNWPPCRPFPFVGPKKRANTGDPGSDRDPCRQPAFHPKRLRFPASFHSRLARPVQRPS